MNLADAINYTFEHREAWMNGSGATTTRINCNHALRILGDIDVFSITTADFTRLSSDLKAEGKSKSTINRITSALRTVMSELQLNGFNIDAPAFKRQKEKQGRREYFTEDEMNLILNEAAKEPDFMLLHDSLLFAYKTGCRQGEMLKLKFDQVSFETGQLIFLDTKNGDDHEIPIHQSLVEVLQRRSHYSVDDYVFPWTNDDQLRTEFYKVRDKLGISPDKVWHTVRHTVGTELVSKGAPMRIIMSLLNHKNMNTTLRYAKVKDTAKQEALDLL